MGFVLREIKTAERRNLEVKTNKCAEEVTHEMASGQSPPQGHEIVPLISASSFNGARKFNAKFSGICLMRSHSNTLISTWGPTIEPLVRASASNANQGRGSPHGSYFPDI